jgi:hypothetical protein
MLKYIVVFSIFSAQSCYAFNTQSAESLVRKYSSTIACSVNPSSFKAVQTIGEPGVEEVGDEYVVYWEGDVGCAGGNGSVSGVLSVVRKNGFGQPLVEPYLKSPEIKMVCADKIAVSNGLVTLSGITYDDDDSQHSPSKPIEIVLKAEYEQFKMVKKNMNPKTKISTKCVENIR